MWSSEAGTGKPRVSQMVRAGVESWAVSVCMCYEWCTTSGPSQRCWSHRHQSSCWFANSLLATPSSLCSLDPKCCLPRSLQVMALLFSHSCPVRDARKLSFCRGRAWPACFRSRTFIAFWLLCHLEGGQVWLILPFC